MSRQFASLVFMSVFTLSAGSCSLPELPELKIPADLACPHVDAGEGKFKKTIFFDRARIGYVTDMVYHRFKDEPDPLLAIVGSWGVVYADTGGQPKKVQHFPSGRPEFTRLVEMRRDGVQWFLTRGQLYVGLLNQTGRPAWIYTSYWGIDDAAAGDVNGDGISEVVVGLNGFGGVRLLDSEGHTIWGRYWDGNIWRVAIIPAMSGARGRIYHTEAGGELRIRDATGTPLASCRPDSEYISQFEPTRWGDDSAPGHFVAMRNGYVLVFDRDGLPTARLSTPNSSGDGHACATPVRFGDSAVYFATLVRYTRWNRSVLYLHNGGGNLVYKEVFLNICAAVATVPNGLMEKLLVGCGSAVWQFKPATAPTKIPEKSN